SPTGAARGLASSHQRSARLSAAAAPTGVFRPFQANWSAYDPTESRQTTMCGIVGAIAERDIVPILMEGLRRLEYRGYDSAGIAVLNGSHHLTRLRTVGKVKMLNDALEQTPTAGKLGIAHTRWATHGVPSERNAHPHIPRDGLAIGH